MEQKPGATALSAKWVVTNKGTPKAPMPTARLETRKFVSTALERDTLFSGTPGLTKARSLISKAATCRSSRNLYGHCERRSEVIRPELGCEADQVLIRDTPRSSGRGMLRGLGMYYHKEKNVETNLHVDKLLVVGEEEHLLNAALEKVDDRDGGQPQAHPGAAQDNRAGVL